MLDQFASRSYQPERLDTGDYTPEEYSRWHREMKVIHRVFGEIRALRSALVPELNAFDRHNVSILDIGAGSGEILREIYRWVTGWNSFLVGAELNPEAARTIKYNSLSHEIKVLQCDALRLPFADSSFDFVFCSLFMHHFTDEKSVELLREMSRVARRRIFVIDLHRSVIAYYFFRVASRLLLQRFTREDGALSILRSFRPNEMEHLATQANLTDVVVRRSWAYRLVLSGMKNDV